MATKIIDPKLAAELARLKADLPEAHRRGPEKVFGSGGSIVNSCVPVVVYSAPQPEPEESWLAWRLRSEEAKMKASQIQDAGREAEFLQVQVKALYTNEGLQLPSLVFAVRKDQAE
jgi:hypothetical protein